MKGINLPHLPKKNVLIEVKFLRVHIYQGSKAHKIENLKTTSNKITNR